MPLLDSARQTYEAWANEPVVAYVPNSVREARSPISMCIPPQYAEQRFARGDPDYIATRGQLGRERQMLLAEGALVLAPLLAESRAAAATGRIIIAPIPEIGGGVSPIADRSWKLFIVGRAQKTGTAGHQFRIYREAITMAKSGKYERIWLNRSYGTATDFQPCPLRRPDIIGKSRDGSFSVIEVPSKTDLDELLILRNEQAIRQFPPGYRIKFEVRRVLPEKKP